MADIVVIEVKTKKGRAASKGKKAKNAPTHPKVSEMVNSAISSLKERGGSSLQAIKKYISSQYKVDVEKLSPFIKKYLKTAVLNGNLVQTKGKGASGSFKMGGSAKEKPTTKPKKKPIKAAKPKKASVSSPKKSAVVKKATEKKKPKKATPAKKPKPAAKAARKVKTLTIVTTKKIPKSNPKKTAGKKGKK